MNASFGSTDFVFYLRLWIDTGWGLLVQSILLAIKAKIDKDLRYFQDSQKGFPRIVIIDSRK